MTTLLREALKKKGIGPHGSKNFSADILREVLPALADPNTNEATASAFFMACLILDNSEAEQQLLKEVFNKPELHLMPCLQSLLRSDSDSSVAGKYLELLRLLSQKKSLRFEQASLGAKGLLSENVPAWMKGAFLQGARLKRETLTENVAFIKVLWEAASHVQVDVPLLLDLADSYDGTNRSYHLTPFYACVLGAMGFPTVVHGCYELAPKYGITSAKVLEQAGKSWQMNPAQAKQQCENPEVYWAYLDQSHSFTALHELKNLRHDIVKRPFLATLEKYLQPLRAPQGNILICAYVHSDYRTDILRILSSLNQCEQAYNLRSIEGSTHLWAKKNTSYIGYRRLAFAQENPPLAGDDKAILTDFFQPLDNGEQKIPLPELLQSHQHQLLEGELDPQTFGIHRNDQEIDKNITVAQIVSEGFQALQGTENLAADLIVFHAATFVCLAGLIHDPLQAAQKAREVIQNGKAWQHWIKAL